MSLRIEVVDRNAGGTEQRHSVLAFVERELAMETLGMSLNEGKTLLAAVQTFLVAQQVREDLERRRACPHCDRRHISKDSGTTAITTVLGSVEVDNPRWKRCECQDDGPATFRPLRIWLDGQVSPEMLYLETKVGFVDPVCASGGIVERCVAGE